MALRFKPSRFFLKGKVSYMHKHIVREEVSQVWNEHKRRRYKKQSEVLVLGLHKKYLEFLAGGKDYMRLVKAMSQKGGVKQNWQIKSKTNVKQM